MSARKVRNQLYVSLQRHLLIGFSHVLLITSLLLISCTRDEVFSAVSTAVADVQTTRAAEQTRESGQTTPASEASDTIDGAATLPSPIAESVSTEAGEDETAIATSAELANAPTATLLVPSTPTLPPATPTLAATLAPTSTPTPSLTPSPTPLADVIEQDGAELLLVAGGPFEMGVAATTLLVECNIFRSGCQESWFGASEPAHTLTLNPYYIDATEVTNEAYIAFLNSLGSHESSCLEQSCLSLDSSRLTVDAEGIYQISEEEADYPVAGVSWYGAAAYCTWRGGRLPSEAEWEMAASWDIEAETKLLYPWGDTFDGRVVNSCDASCEQPQANAAVDDSFAQEAPVGSFADGRSPIGAYDMGGNVWEWVADWYDADYYNAETTTPTGPEEGEDKVVRGGSWFDTGNFTATAIRFPSPPTNTDGSIGFRCAADA